MTDELERIWKEVVVAQSRYYPSVCLEELMKATEFFFSSPRLRFEPSPCRIQV
jgi:hypothetical protein